MKIRQADVVVIGAGPAGLCSALRLHQLGYHVVLVERSTLWPRPQIGEALTPGVRNIIDLLDANNALASVPIIVRLPTRVRWRMTEAEDMRHGDSAVVERAHFDAVLLQLADKRGVEIMRPARVLTRGGEAGRWQLVVGHGQCASRVDARFVIEASGRGGCRLDCSPALSAIWIEWDCAHLSANMCGTTRVEALKTGWLWGTRLPDHRYRAMLLADPSAQHNSFPSRPEEGLRAACAASTLFFELSAATSLTQVRVCAASPYLDTEAWQPGWVKTGDAAFAIDPISSSGVEKAMRFSLQAVTAAHTFLQSDDPAQQALAGEFFEDRLIETCARHCAWTREYYAQAWCAEEAFWQERSVARSSTSEDGALRHWRDRIEERAIRLSHTTPEPIEVSAPLQRQQAIRFCAGVETVRALCVMDNQVRMCPALAHPRLVRPLAFFEDHALLPCLNILWRQPTFDEVVSVLASLMNQGKALQLLVWLWRQGVIESTESGGHTMTKPAGGDNEVGDAQGALGSGG